MKKRNETLDKIGIWSFYIGLILAAIIAIFQAKNPAVWATITIGLLGILVGCINVMDREVQRFLIAAIAFMLSFAALSNLAMNIFFNWTPIATFFNLLNVFIAPATAVVALKEIWEITRSK